MYVVCVCLGLGSLSQAHDYLSKAEWTVMKTPGCSHTVLHQLHRTLGRLHAAMGKYTSALTHFANDVSPNMRGTLIGLHVQNDVLLLICGIDHSIFLFNNYNFN